MADYRLAPELQRLVDTVIAAAPKWSAAMSQQIQDYLRTETNHDR